MFELLQVTLLTKCANSSNAYSLMLMLSIVPRRTYVSWPFHDMAEGHDHFCYYCGLHITFDLDAGIRRI